MKPEAYSERKIEINGWQIRLTSYRLNGEFYCTADNVSPGAWLARTRGANRREAEQQALDKARKLLARAHRQAA